MNALAALRRAIECPAAARLPRGQLSGLARRAAAPPNVLVICADDHAAYVTGCTATRMSARPTSIGWPPAGFASSRPIAIRRSARPRGSRFLCGRYPRSIGVTLLQTPLPESEVTMAETLKLAGFDTASIGKMHFNSDLTHGFDLRIDMPEYRRWLRSSRSRRRPRACWCSRRGSRSRIRPGSG